MKNSWEQIPKDEEINETIGAAKLRGFEVFLVEGKKEALDKIIELIPNGAEVMNGSSTTLNEIGFSDFLKNGKHGWKNLHEEVLKEKDMAKQGDLRRKATASEYFLGSVNAISKNGALVSCDNSGSRVGAYLFSAKNLILVSGVNKITGSIDEAMKRSREYAFGLEDKRAKAAYGFNSNVSKWAIIEKEINPHRIKLILVKEKLGF